MSTLTFALGETVSWQSQSKGYWAGKQGTIVEIVPAGANPQAALKNPGFARAEVSYVVSVPAPEPKTKRAGWKPGALKLYWPRVVALQKVKAK